jgi:hypothetical protein
MMISKLSALSVSASLVFAVVACSREEPTDYEKGQVEANKRLDYAQGAGEALHDKGGSVGRVAGDGVGSLLRGIGTGVVDVVYPPVKINPSPMLDEAGIAINKCTEGSGSDVELTASFSKVYKGRIQMKAFDRNNVEIGRADSKTINQPPDSLLSLTFSFPSTMRLSDIAYGTLTLLATAPVTVVETPISGAGASPDAAENPAGAGISLGQMQEKDAVPPAVSLYVIFNLEFKGSIQLRAYDATDTEIGRSPKKEGVEYAADTSDTLDFSFNSEIDRASIARYALHVVRAADPPKKGKKR